MINLYLVNDTQKKKIQKLEYLGTQVCGGGHTSRLPHGEDEQDFL